MKRTDYGGGILLCTTLLGIRRQVESELRDYSTFIFFLVVYGMVNVYQQRRIQDRANHSAKIDAETYAFAT